MYVRLKDIVTGDILEPHPEPALGDVAPGKTMFSHFMDNDMGGTDSFQSLCNFLHHHYFPLLASRQLTLNPAKSAFFIDKVDILRHSRTSQGIRPSADKIAAIHDYPSSATEEELD